MPSPSPPPKRQSLSVLQTALVGLALLAHGSGVLAQHRNTNRNSNGNNNFAAAAAVTPPTQGSVYVGDAREHVLRSLTGAGVPRSAVSFRPLAPSRHFNGLSFSIDGWRGDIDLVHAIPGASNAWKVQSLQRPRPRAAVQVAANSDNSSDDRLRRRAAGAAPSSINDIHTLTGVTDVWNLYKFNGENTTIAVIDSGVYYLHPALGGGFGEQFKVAKGSDFVGDDFGTTGVPVPDDDPLDNCSPDAHGTHIAGVIAGDGPDTGFGKFTGVAPAASIYAYRVLSCTGGTTDDIVAAAMLQAAADGAQVIVHSITNSKFGTPSTLLSRVATELTDAGVVVVAAAGNDGEYGLFSGEAPAVGHNVISVTSFDNAAYPKSSVDIAGQAFLYNPGGKAFGYYTSYTPVLNDPSILSGESYNDSTSCNPSKPASASFQVLFIAVASPSACTVEQRCESAMLSGYDGCMLFSTDSDIDLIVHSVFSPISVGSMDYKSVVSIFGNDGDQTMTFSSGSKLFSPTSAGTVSPFSSLGLTTELKIRPNFGAIGGGVYSTVSPYAQEYFGLDSPYAVYSGTSQATAYAAGVVALVLDAYNSGTGVTSAFINNIISNTAVPAVRRGFSQLDSVASQGAGLINAKALMDAITLVSPASISLGDFTDQNKLRFHAKAYPHKPANLTLVHILNITNYGEEPMTYVLSSRAALTANAFDGTSPFINTKYFPTVGATVLFGRQKQNKTGSPTFTIKVNPRSTSHVMVSFQRPADVYPSLFPVYSGFIVVQEASATAAANQSFVVPYAGLAAKWSDAPLWTQQAARPSGIYYPDSLEPVRNGDVVDRAAGVVVEKVLSTPTSNYRIEVHRSSAASPPPASTDPADPATNELQSPSPDTDASFDPSSAAALRQWTHTFAGYLYSLPVAASTATDGSASPEPFAEVDLPLGRAAAGGAATAQSLWKGDVVQTARVSLQAPTPLPQGQYRLVFRALKYGTKGMNVTRDYESFATPSFWLY
ncbi:peptidase S8/S53 domain-containing protein [Zopfochytrium polystomum]|nr:peptidase S8/S53 domain-containing protein [Zopfochytrium polystomum]